MNLFHNTEPKYSFKKSIDKNKEKKQKKTKTKQTKFPQTTSVFLFTDAKLCLIFFPTENLKLLIKYT